MAKKLLIFIFVVILTVGCSSPLAKFRCVYDMYGDSAVYYVITVNGDYLKTVKHKHTIVSKFDSLKNRWQNPVDIFYEKKDSVLLGKELQDSLVRHVETSIRNDKDFSSCISTNTSIITLTWNNRNYKLHYLNNGQRGLISFLKKHSSIKIR